MSDSDAIRRALGGFPDREKQGDNANIRNALNDTFYAAMDSIYKLPYPERKATPVPPKPATPAPTQTPSSFTRPQAAPQPPAQTAGGNWFSKLVDDFNNSNEQAQQFLRGIKTPDLPEVVEGAGGFLWGAGNTVAGLLGNITDAVAGGANALDEAMIRAQNRGQLPQGYEPFTEQVADLAGQWNENIAEPLAGLGMAGVNQTPFGQSSQIGRGLTSYLMGDTEGAAKQMYPDYAPQQGTQDAGNAMLQALQRGDAGAALKNGLDVYKQYGNEQYDRLDPVTALAASLIFDPLNFIPGLGIGKLQKASKLDDLARTTGYVDNVVDLFPKNRLYTPVARVTQAVKEGLGNFLHKTSFIDDAEEYFATARRFEEAGKDAKAFNAVIKGTTGMDTVPAQLASRLMQGIGKNIDEVEQAYHTIESGLKAGTQIDPKTLPKNFARFLNDVKAGRTTADELLDFTKAEMAERTQAYMAKQAASYFPQNRNAPTNLARRFLNNVKAAEALVFIGLSPFTFVRNFVNGKVTMAIEGVNPLWDATKEISRLKKMGQVSKAADLQRALNMQKTLSRTGEAVRGAFGEGEMALAQTGAFGSFMSRMFKATKLGKPLEWYQNIENSMRAQVWSHTYWNAVNQNWDTGKWIPKVDAATEAMLSQYRVNPQDIVNVVREAGPDEKKILRAVKDLLSGKRGAALDYDALAAEMGVSKQELLMLMDEKDQAKAASMAQEIAARVAAGENKAAVVDEVIAEAAQETAQATAAKTGQTLGAADEIEELLNRRGDLVRQFADAQKGKGAANRKIVDDLMGEIDAVERRLQELQGAQSGATNTTVSGVSDIGKSVDVPSDAGVQPSALVDEGLPPPTPNQSMPDVLKGIVDPEDWEQMDSYGRITLFERTIAQRKNAGNFGLSEVYQGKGDVPTALPEPNIVSPQATSLGDVLWLASQKGIATSTEKGAPLNKHLINVLNKHRNPDSPRFLRMDDVVERSDEVAEILGRYAPDAPNAASVANVSPSAVPDEVAELQARYDKVRQDLKNAKSQRKTRGLDVDPNLSRQIDFLEKQSKGLGFQLSAAKKKAGKGGNVGNVSDRSLRGIDPDEMHTSAPPTQKQNAADAIETLRQVAQPDEVGEQLLSADEMVKAKARTQADVYEALLKMWNRDEVRRVRVGTDAENKVFGWLRREVLPATNDARMAATVAADWMDNAVMISRDGETIFDAALSILSPFQFWRSRYAIQSLRRVADKPARLAWYMNLREAADQVQNDERYPKRLQGKTFIPVPGVPAWAGGGVWMNLPEAATSLEQVFGANRFEDEVTDAEVAQAIRALAASGEISMTEAANAVANMKGTLWEQTKSRMLELSSTAQGVDDFSSMFRPHMPIDIIHKLMTGRAEEIGVLFPATRIVRGLTGVNIEQPLKAGLRAVTGAQDIPDWDMWEEQRTDKALADMVGDGLISERDALLAMVERKGAFYDQAKARAKQQTTIQNFSVFGGQVFPEGEKAYYKARILQNKLLDEAVASLGANPQEFTTGEKWELVKANNLTARGTPLGEFYRQNPVYGARQSVYDEPEKKLKDFLADEIWNKYNEKGALDKRLMADDLGDEFRAKFLSRETRDMENVTLDQLGEWVRRVRAYVPQQEILKVGEFPQVRYGTADQNARYGAIQEQASSIFNMDVLRPKLDAYGDLGQDAKYAARDADPYLDAYLDWYSAKMRANPDVSQLINPDYQQRAGSYVNTRDAANDVTRYAVQNIERMVQRIAGRQGRGGGGGLPTSPTTPPAPLSKKALQALTQKRANPQYYIPREVYEELLAYFRASGVRMPFQSWLQQMVARGGM